MADRKPHPPGMSVTVGVHDDEAIVLLDCQHCGVQEIRVPLSHLPALVHTFTTICEHEGIELVDPSAAVLTREVSDAEAQTILAKKRPH